MDDNQIKVGSKQTCYNVNGTRVLKYVVEMSHAGLNEHKIISAPQSYMLDNKVDLQKRKWAEKWEEVSSRRKANSEKEANIEEANRRTKEANSHATSNAKNIKTQSERQILMGSYRLLPS
jgi:hypothetical protein